MNITLIGAKNLSEQGGIETYVREVSKELIKRGHIVNIIVNNNKKSSLEGANIYSVSCIQNRYLTKITMLPLVIWKAKKIKTDIYHANDIVGGFGASIFLKPTLYTSHGIGYKGQNWHPLVKIFLFVMQKTILKLASKIITVDFRTQEFIEKTINQTIPVIPNGVDIEIYNKRYPFPSEFKKGKVNVIFIGRLIASKGAYFLAKNFSGIDAQLTIIGEGPEEDKIKKISNKNVRYIGFRDYKHIPMYIKNADIFVLPSEYEGLPIALLEAMAGGLACISFKVGDLPKRFKHLENIFFTNKANLNKAIKYLIDNNELRKKIGHSAKKEIEKNYTWKNTADKLEKLYYNLMNNKLR